MNIYVDTSVIGGCFDEEFAEWSNQLFNEFVSGKKLLMLSDLTLQELEFANEDVRKKISKVPTSNQIKIGIVDEAIQLGEAYILEGALTNKSYNDALHIALGTIFNADALASWNFQHIVNLERIRLYNSINIRHGYKMIEIRTPREILNPTDQDNENR